MRGRARRARAAPSGPISSQACRSSPEVPARSRSRDQTRASLTLPGSDRPAKESAQRPDGLAHDVVSPIYRDSALSLFVLLTIDRLTIEYLRLRMSDHRSPTAPTRSAIVRIVKVCGWT